MPEVKCGVAGFVSGHDTAYLLLLLNQMKLLPCGNKFKTVYTGMGRPGGTQQMLLGLEALFYPWVFSSGLV